MKYFVNQTKSLLSNESFHLYVNNKKHTKLFVSFPNEYKLPYLSTLVNDFFQYKD